MFKTLFLLGFLLNMTNPSWAYTEHDARIAAQAVVDATKKEESFPERLFCLPQPPQEMFKPFSIIEKNVEEKKASVEAIKKKYGDTINKSIAEGDWKTNFILADLLTLARLEYLQAYNEYLFAYIQMNYTMQDSLKDCLNLHIEKLETRIQTLENRNKHWQD